MLRGLWILVPGLLLTSSACGLGGGAPQPADSPVRVEVTNNYALPVDIYAVGSGINQRLGTVHPGMSGEFGIPQALVGGNSVELQVRPSNRNMTFRTGPLLLSPGAVVELIVSPQLFNSTANVVTP